MGWCFLLFLWYFCFVCDLCKCFCFLVFLLLFGLCILDMFCVFFWDFWIGGIRWFLDCDFGGLLFEVRLIIFFFLFFEFSSCGGGDISLLLCIFLKIFCCGIVWIDCFRFVLVVVFLVYIVFIVIFGFFLFCMVFMKFLFCWFGFCVCCLVGVFLFCFLVVEVMGGVVFVFDLLLYVFGFWCFCLKDGVIIDDIVCLKGVLLIDDVVIECIWFGLVVLIVFFFILVVVFIMYGDDCSDDIVVLFCGGFVGIVFIVFWFCFRIVVLFVLMLGFVLFEIVKFCFFFGLLRGWFCRRLLIEEGFLLFICFLSWFFMCFL